MAQTTESDHTKPHNTTGSTSSAFESLTSKVGALLLNRVELMLLEAGSAKHTVWAGVILSLLGVLSVFMAALFALLLIILVAPESWRIGLLGGFTLFFVLFALFAFGWVRRAVRTPWFASSMGAVKEDWQTLTEQNLPTPASAHEARQKSSPTARENTHE